MCVWHNGAVSNDHVGFHFDNTYARELSGFFVPVTPARPPRPALARLNRGLAEAMGLDVEALAAQAAEIFSGARVPPGAEPIAQAYAGHQFGGFSPRLGDGRALLLGEHVDRAGTRRDLSLKGSGRTVFSRGGDGKAALGPMLREYVMGEAMHALGVPTTRALAVVTTGDVVPRDRPLPGAVLARVAASHLRVGTFELFAARGEYDQVRRLADYAIRRHDPALVDAPDRYLGLLRAVAARQAELIARWMLVGFIHGVMNTDNMTLSGETIDYGPCAFLEAYDPVAVFSSIDHQGRYAFGRQPAVARWNLARFAETLLPLIDPADPEAGAAQAMEVLDAFPARYERHLAAGVRAKLGLAASEPDDAILARDWLALLADAEVDHTLAWRALADAVTTDGRAMEALVQDPGALRAWLERWRARGAREALAPTERAAAMRAVSPVYIPRNERVEEALEAAQERGDLGPFERLLEAVTKPFEAREGFEVYARPAPREVTARYQTFCGT
jgi:uncharacterized protein YdiU (UPF0061 family)